DSTMLDVTRMLTEKTFRNEVLSYVKDPVVKNFWTVEFASWNDKFATEAVAPILNKVGAFTANPIVRNIVGQPKSSFNIREIMDKRKILIVNLSRGLVGEDNAALLGSLLVTKIQLAAMSRADIDNVVNRVPFYLYVDEFQNFATDSFATILSEARKYGLCLTVANQYIAQMTQEVRDAVFGNVGSTIAFRMGADDARVMQRYFEPRFEEHDLVHMNNRNFVISLTIGGEKAQAFSGTSLNLPPQTGSNNLQEIIDYSRQTYSVPLRDIEEYVQDRYVKPTSKHKPTVNKEPISPPQTVNYETESTPKVSKSIKSTSETLGSVVVPALTSAEPIKKKRKRTRRRKKTSDSPVINGGNTANKDTNKSESTKVDQELNNSDSGSKNLSSDGHIVGDGTIQLR
ncbi:type IV secretory system conjugative DNA transfer family protein, partial [Candidatus Saccharibacteria bacterium]|nr:type IV secretory system conjugative DNA transfer family protein [Candidatus Saccharibacteria bacterium]